MDSRKTFMFVFVFLLLVLASGFASASTFNFYPTSGYDTTGSGTYVMNQTDLAKVSSSDDIRYKSFGMWPKDIDSEEIVWEFSPNVTDTAIINNAKLIFEWQRGWFVEDSARIWIWDESQNEWGETIWLNNPTKDNDITEIIDLSSYINTPEDINHLKIKFQAMDCYNPDRRRTQHDLVKLRVDYDLPDTTAPSCELDYIKNKLTGDKYFFGPIIYTNEDGKYYLFGTADDTESSISLVQYNRTSPNDNWIWDDAVAVDGDFNELNEIWDTDFNDNAFVEGMHFLCCRATDDSGNGPEGSEDCGAVCVDTTAPETPQVSFDNPSECVFNYINEIPKFSWTNISETDDGCAPISYDVEVYYANGSLDYSIEDTTETNIKITGAVNGEGYFMRVRAKDLAGNIGSWSENSTTVYYDIEDPSIEITGMPWNATVGEGYAWYNDDFKVFEEDSDNLGIWKTEYKVHVANEAGDVVNWTEIDEDGNFTVKIPEECYKNGLNECWVYKRTTDYACNQKVIYKKYDIDTLPPETEKVVSAPRYIGRLFSWIGMDWMVDWFVRSDTNFTLNCDDAGMSGCNATYYRLNYNNQGWGNWTTYTEPFNLENDGIYEVEYYSVDNVGNVEETNYEIDKVDNEGPTTVKTESPLYEVNTNYDFTGEPNYTVAGEDAVLIWKEGNIWKLRWTDDWSDQTWSEVKVRIITETPVTNLSKYSYENDCTGNHPDCLDYYNGSQMIIADTWVDSGDDGIEFSQENPNGSVTFEVYYNGVLSVDKVFLGGQRLRPLTNPFSVPMDRWVSGNTSFRISASDSEVGVLGIGYNIDEDDLTLEEGNSTEFNLAEYCEDYINHEIEYSSIDFLGNYDSLKKQLISLDCLPPEITVLNPTMDQEENKCSLSVVSKVKDAFSGVNTSTVKVELINSTGDVVREKSLANNLGSYFSGVVDLDTLPAGDYVVRVSAHDNVENYGHTDVPITLTSGVTVEQVVGDCEVEAGSSKTCTFSFQICSRNSSAVSLWISKLYSIQDGEKVLLDVIDPFILNSTIFNEYGNSSVGLSEGSRHPAQLAPLRFTEDKCDKVNGRIYGAFTLGMDFSANDTEVIGSNQYYFDYDLQAYNYDDECSQQDPQEM